MNKLEAKAQELTALSESIGLTPEVTAAEDRIFIRHAEGIYSVVDYTATAKVRVFSWETTGTRKETLSAKHLPEYLQYAANRIRSYKSISHPDYDTEPMERWG
jgi:hypothetical protein